MDTAFFRRAALFAGIAVALVGAVVLFGWYFDSAPLKSVLPNRVTMKPNTALSLFLLGCALSLSQLRAEKRRLVTRVTRVLSSLAIGIGLLSAAEYATGAHLHIDQLLFTEAEDAVHTSHPARMAPLTAGLFILMGLTIPSVRSRTGRLFIQIAGATTVLLSALSILGYVFGAEWFQGAGAYTPMAIHTATSFLILSLGVFLASPDYGIVAALRSQSAGGALLRRLLPAAIIIPILLSWLRFVGESAGLYGTRFAVVLHTAAAVAVLVAVVSWCAVYLDRMDRQRRIAENDLERFFSLSLDLFCVAGLDGYFKRLNPSWSRMLGFSADELTARPYIEFVHPDDRDATLTAASNLAEGEDIFTFRNRYLKKDGTYIWLEWVSRAPESGSRVIHAVARDITQQKVSEERLRHLNTELQRSVRATRAANKELEAFSYSVSHDLRAPLRAITGFSNILRQEHAESLSEEGKRLLRIVCENTDRMGSLIDDLLDFSRTARKPLEPSLVDIGALVAERVARLRSAESGRNLRFDVDELPPARGDRGLLDIVWGNLLANAVKYTRTRDVARIELRGWLESGEIVYCIKDNGIGFDMKYSHKLFGVFQRLHSDSEFEGTGVGLALAQRIVTRHRGRIWAEGWPEKGAAFYFALPREGVTDEKSVDGGRPAFSGGQSLRRGADDPGAEEAQSRQQVASG